MSSKDIPNEPSSSNSQAQPDPIPSPPSLHQVHLRALQERSEASQSLESRLPDPLMSDEDDEVIQALKEEDEVLGDREGSDAEPTTGGVESRTRKEGAPPLRRFQSAAKKVVNVQRTTSSRIYRWSPRTSPSFSLVHPEPGIDARRIVDLSEPEDPSASSGGRPDQGARRRQAAQLSLLSSRVRIEVADYSEDKVEFAAMDNAGFGEFLGAQEGKCKKPEWSKVRFIAVHGIDWEVIKMLQLEYDLHPLAIEDALHVGSSSRSKADYYANHLFLRLLCHTLAEDETQSSASSSIPSTPPSYQPKDQSTSQEPISLHPDTSSSESLRKVDPSGQRVENGNGVGVEGYGTIPETSVETGARGGGVEVGKSGILERLGLRKRRKRDVDSDSIESGRPVVSKDHEPTAAGHSQQTDQRGNVERQSSWSALGLGGGLRKGGTLDLGTFGKSDGDSPLSNLTGGGEKASHTKAARLTVQRLTKDFKVHLHVEQCSLFMMRDGTLIALFQRSGHSITSPIFSRLAEPQTLLRSTEDASMLVQAVLDIIADRCLDIVEAFRKQLMLLEAKVLITPDMQSVRHLHVLSGELLLLKRTLTPIHSLVHSMREHDIERTFSNRHHQQSFSSEMAGEKKDFMTVSGYMSPQARVYLADVQDHLDAVISSLDLFSGLAQNLVDFSFNVFSFNMNESMKALSIVTVIFLPVTALTGYFGMNFTGFDEIQGSVAYFWKITIPVVGAVILVFAYSYIAHSFRGVKRRLVGFSSRNEATRAGKGSGWKEGHRH